MKICVMLAGGMRRRCGSASGSFPWEVAWWLGELVRGGDVWRLVGWPLVPLALLAWLSDRGERVAWPVAALFCALTWFEGGVVPLAAFLWLWMLYGNFASRGDAVAVAVPAAGESLGSRPRWGAADAVCLVPAPAWVAVCAC